MNSPSGFERSDSRKLSSKRAAAIAPPQLTKREIEVVAWIAEGKRNREIGQILGCSDRTVQKHIQHILEKLSVETRTSVCTWWHESGPRDGQSSTGRRRRNVARRK